MVKRSLTEAQKRRVAASYGWRCAVCNETVAAVYAIDHVIPLWDGGEDTVEACQLLCVACHAHKTQREAIERAQRKRRLKAAAKHSRRPALECLGCGAVCSPYFRHVCPHITRRTST